MSECVRESFGVVCVCKREGNMYKMLDFTVVLVMMESENIKTYFFIIVCVFKQDDPSG